MIPLAFACPYDLALTYSLRRPRLAFSLAVDAWVFATRNNRPDLAFKAHELMSALA